MENTHIFYTSYFAVKEVYQPTLVSTSLSPCENLRCESLIPKIESEYVFQLVRNEMDLELITYKRLFKKLYFVNYWAPSVIRASLTEAINEKLANILSLTTMLISTHPIYLFNSEG